MSSPKRAGRRERLLARKRPTVDYHLAVVDDTEAVAELAAAKDARDVAQIAAADLPAATADERLNAADERLRAAQQAVEDCYEAITLTAMPPADFEALAGKPEHAPREGKNEQWNEETFPRAVFLACAPDDLTPDEWESFADSNLTQGERTALFMTAVGLNARWPSGSIPEG